jgi:uncharacterized protein
MKIVWDTNSLLVSISSRSKFFPLMQGFLQKTFSLIVTTDILLEYEEIIGQEMGEETASDIMDLFSSAKNIHRITRYYYWNLIENDPDDNKFVDAAIAGNADFIVSDDAHFRVLAKITQPKIIVLTSEKFLSFLSGKQ